MTDIIYIGIDPDTKASGVAHYNKQLQTMVLHNMPFFDLYDYLLKSKLVTRYGIRLKVIIEAGWLKKKSNWHGDVKQEKHVGERISKNVGSNHETGRKIVEMCNYLEIEHELVLPMGKVTPEYFASMTGQKVRDQDMIDAGCLVWGR